MADVKFGTSGLRGRVEDLTDVLCRLYVRAFLHHMKQSRGLKRGDRIFIGRDLRADSPRLAAAACREIHFCHYHAVNCGMIPTPALAYAALINKAPAIMVTGSHIPADRNGLKFYRPDGEIDKQDEAAISAYVSRNTKEIDDSNGEKISLPPQTDKAQQIYLQRGENFLLPEALKGQHIGIYRHSTVARDILTEIVKTLGAKVKPFGQSEKFIALDTEALRAEDREIALKAAKEYKIDALISADGDGDRPLLADENGDFFHGDIVGILSAYFLRADTVVTPITTTTALEQSGFFRRIIRCRVGSPFVLAAMAEAAAKGAKRIIGFEANGGLLQGSSFKQEPPCRPGILLNALPTRDAVLPILCMLALAQQKNLPLSGLRQILPPRFTATGRLQNYPPEKAQAFLEQLKHINWQKSLPIDPGKVCDLNSLDGIRLTFANGDILYFRVSGNAPELRCYTESTTAARAQQLLKAGLELSQRSV